MKPLEAPKNLHPKVPKTGPKVDQKHLDGYAFFSSALQYEVAGKFQKVQNFEFLSFLDYQKQNVYVSCF